MMKQADCETVQKQIPLYIDNMLSDEEQVIVKEHIKKCDACQSELALRSSILVDLATLPEPELSEGFHERFVENLKQEASKPRIRARIPWKKVTSFAAAAAVVALSVVSFFQLEQSDGGQNPDVYLTEPTPAVQQGVSDEGEASSALVSETEATQAPPQEGRALHKTQGKPAGKQETHLPQVAKEMTEGQPAVYTPSSRMIAEDGQGDADAASGSETESSEPAAQEAFSGETVPDKTIYSVVTVTVAETAKEQAEEILSMYAKDDYGYAVGDSLNDVLARLEALEGYSAVTEDAEEIAGNYIVLQ